MLDISVIILTYNEEIHIKRCIENVKLFTKHIFVVDSYSTDKTEEIALELGAVVYKNKWEKKYSKQFNWGLDNLPIKTKWILRLDADEYITTELIEELKQRIDTLPNNISGVIFNRRVYFFNKWMKNGVYPVKLLRLFEYKKGFCEDRFMDEHIQLTEGETIEFQNDFIDHNLNDFSWWIDKHNGYAIREAIDLLNIELGLINENSDSNNLGNQAVSKRKKKYRYTKLPIFFRSFIYFIYRFILKGGFLEGKEGFIWNFFQAWWYRTLVDVKIYEIKKVCGSDNNKIINYIKERYNIDIKE